MTSPRYAGFTSPGGRILLCALLSAARLLLPSGVAAQENYEIQVYESETLESGKTMVELHSNVAVKGTTHKVDGVLPTEHALHATVEVTHGFTPWFETAFYIFTSIQPETGWEWVGDHIRPKLRIPERWGWPVGPALAAEAGYQQRRFAIDTCTMEIRPIIDKRLGRWYFSLNPVIGKALRGDNASRGFDFSPSFKISYDITPKITAGIEYYGGLGPLGDSTCRKINGICSSP